MKTTIQTTILYPRKKANLSTLHVTFRGLNFACKHHPRQGMNDFFDRGLKVSFLVILYPILEPDNI